LGSASEKATDQFVIEPREKATDSTAQSAEQPQEPAEPAEPSVSRKEETTARIPTDVIQVTSSGGPSEYANHPFVRGMSRLTRTHLALEADRDRLEKETVKARGKVSSAFIQFISTVPVPSSVLINPSFCYTQKLRLDS
jgi:hypothetical protein